MKLVETKCPNCASSIKVEDKRDKISCDYCGTNFLLDDNTIKVKHLAAGEISEEQEFKNAETNLNKLKNYKDAYDIYLSLSKRYVDDKNIWIGLLRSFTRDFTYKLGSAAFQTQYQRYWNNYKALASDEDIEQYEDKYQNYVDNVREKLIKDISDLETQKVNSVEDKCYLVVTLFLGFLGIHKFLKGEKTMGLVYLFTFGLFGFGWICDIYKEYKKWPESNQINVVKYVLCFLVVGLGIIQLEYSLLTFILLMLSAFLILDIVWKKVNLKNKYIRIGIPIILLVVGMMYGTKAIPNECFGTWTTKDVDAKYSKIVISSDSVKLYETDDIPDLMSGVYYESIIYLTPEEGGNKIKMKYDVQKSQLCILDSDDNCNIIYVLEKDKTITLSK